MQEKNGFTLVELLVVIAIIAILTAIAVPNIMSANIRAKIKGIKSDIGSIAIALEDYRIDNENNEYPSGNATHPDAIKNDDGVSVGLGRLTPIYLSSIPKDPFNDSEEPGGHYSYFTTGDSTPTGWALISYGPDRDRDIGSYAEAKEAVDDGTNEYNSDNGINSSGDITIIGPCSSD